MNIQKLVARVIIALFIVGGDASTSSSYALAAGHGHHQGIIITPEQVWDKICAYIEANHGLCPVEPEALWMLLLELFDTDGNGVLSEDEILAAMEEMGFNWIERRYAASKIKGDINLGWFLIILGVICELVDDPSDFPPCIFNPQVEEEYLIGGPTALR